MLALTKETAAVFAIVLSRAIICFRRDKRRAGTMDPPSRGAGFGGRARTKRESGGRERSVAPLFAEAKSSRASPMS